MTTLRTIRKLLLGETWFLPLGLAVVVLLAALVVKPLIGHDAWRHAGGFVLLAGVLVLFAASIARSR